MIEFLFILAIIVLIIYGIYKLISGIGKSESQSPATYKSNSDYYKVNVEFPHPEKTNDYRFFKFVESTSKVILEPLLPQIKRQGMYLKPEFEAAIKQKISTGEFKNPIDFKEHFGTNFDLIGIQFLKGTDKLLSAFQIGVCYIKDENIADEDKFYFKPPENVWNTKRFQKTLDLFDVDPQFIENYTFKIVWETFELKDYFNANVIALWDEESEILEKVLKFNDIKDYNIRLIKIKEIAEDNNLPTSIDSLLKHFKSSLTNNSDLSLICSSLAIDLKDSGVDLAKYTHCLNPQSYSIDKPKLISKQNVLADFIAIDVETAQGSRWSICQIGLIIVEKSEIKQSISYLIQPPDNKYLKGNIKVHGITPDKTLNEPTFPQVWEKIKPLIEDKMIVAHNAAFDIDCLVQTLNYYKLEIPNFEVDCTFKRTGQRLEDLCAAYNIDLTNHHNAEFDAFACANIYLNLINGIEPNYSQKDKYKPKIKVKTEFDLDGHEKIQGTLLKPDLENADENSPFYGKKVVFTGVLHNIERHSAAAIVQNMGADVDTEISKKTDFVIMGTDPGPSKLNKIVQYNNEGSNIKIIYETEFLKMIN
jgi:DNA polymerase-3 subunit epsilon